MTRTFEKLGPWARFLARIAAIAGTTTLAAMAHPAAGLATAIAGLLWLASRYDNHTGSIMLVTIVFLSAVAILVALLMVALAMASR